MLDCMDIDGARRIFLTEIVQRALKNPRIKRFDRSLFLDLLGEEADEKSVAEHIQYDV